MNRLAATTSPYLLQHKDNPVHWWPWGSEALDEAKRTGKPILLSVGYAACHWCHVMAHESFENESIAALMNELFVNIKVDREERPDVDQIYMAALHALGERGGWPLTMFLTSAGEPIWGGTYFPPESRYGRPGFPDVLRSLASAFHQQPDRIEANRAALHARLSALPDRGDAPLSRRSLDEAASRLAALIDLRHGGTTGAPKFPNAPFLEVLWRAGIRNGDHAMLDKVSLTIDRIVRGGIHDHLGGGFARYSVDERWLVPHFEKMLYDNAQLLELLALVWQRNRQPLHREAAFALVAWLERDMLTAEGKAFSSSLDADSEGEEGRFYVWSAAEIREVLGPDDGALVARVYDVTDGGNWEDHTILNRLDTADPSPVEEARLPALREALLTRRDTRVRPGTDDKVLADWNGLMIAALARASYVFAAPDWIILAQKAYRFVADSMSRDGRLGHAWRADTLLFPGLASDYAAMIRAALALHEATAHGAYLADAERWAALVEQHHADKETGGWFLTADDATALIIRPRSAMDDAMPNAQGMMTENLLRLAVLTGKAAYARRADEALAGLARQVAENIFGHASLLNALDLALAGREIVITGEGPDAQPLLAVARDHSFPSRIILSVSAAANLAEGHPAREKVAPDGKAAALICVGQTCSLPITDPNQLALALAAATPA